MFSWRRPGSLMVMTDWRKTTNIIIKVVTEQFSIECRKLLRVCFGFTLVYYVLWLVSKTCVTFSTKEKQDQDQSGRTRFPELGVGYKHLPWVLIGSLICLRVLWLARGRTLVLVLRHSNENRWIPIDIQNRAHVYKRDGLWDNLSVPELQARNYGNVGTFKVSQTPKCLHQVMQA